MSNLYEVLLMLKQPKINECDFATPLNTTGMGNVQPCDSNGNGTEPLPLNKKMKYITKGKELLGNIQEIKDNLEKLTKIHQYLKYASLKNKQTV